MDSETPKERKREYLFAYAVRVASDLDPYRRKPVRSRPTSIAITLEGKPWATDLASIDRAALGGYLADVTDAEGSNARNLELLVWYAHALKDKSADEPDNALCKQAMREIHAMLVSEYDLDLAEQMPPRDGLREWADARERRFDRFPAVWRGV